MPDDWPVGRSGSLVGVRLVVHLVQDVDGRIASTHNGLTPTDDALLAAMPGGGAAQAAQALLVEAVRREAFASTLALMVGNPDLLRHWNLGGETRKVIEEGLSTAVQETIRRNVARMAVLETKGVLEMMADQFQTGIEGTVKQPTGADLAVDSVQVENPDQFRQELQGHPSDAAGHGEGARRG